MGKKRERKLAFEIPSWFPWAGLPRNNFTRQKSMQLMSLIDLDRALGNEV